MVFVGLARQASSLVRHPSLIGWIHTSTYFSAKKLMRAERRRVAREEKADNMNELFATADPEVDWDRVRPMLDGILHELKDRDRDAILWRFFDAQPLAVIGQKLGVTETAARKRVDRALDTMRSSLRKRGFDSSAAALALMLANHAVIAAPEGLGETVTATALASAAGAGSQAAWLGKVLRTGKSALGISGAIWVGGILGASAIGLAGYELWAAWRANSSLVDERQGYETQLERLRLLNRADVSAHPAVRQGGRPLAGSRDTHADFQKFLATYPQARAMVIAGHKRTVIRTYGSFFRSEGLTPSQIDRFEDAMDENWMHGMTITQGKLAIEDDDAPPEDQMRAILGDQAYLRFQDYGQTAYAHYLADRVAKNSPEASFSADQLDQLARILATNNPVPQIPHSVDQLALASIDWEAVLTQAKPVFSASQWKAAEPALLYLRALGASYPVPRSPDSTGGNSR